MGATLGGGSIQVAVPVQQQSARRRVTVATLGLLAEAIKEVETARLASRADGQGQECDRDDREGPKDKTLPAPRPTCVAADCRIHLVAAPPRVNPVGRVSPAEVDEQPQINHPAHPRFAKGAMS